MSKIIYHIPTEQFGFVEIEKEWDGTDASAVEAYNDLKEAKQPLKSEFVFGVGLDDKEWRIALDGYLEVNTLPSDVYERMSKEQQMVIQEIKKSIKRKNHDN